MHECNSCDNRKCDGKGKLCPGHIPPKAGFPLRECISDVVIVSGFNKDLKSVLALLKDWA